MRCAGETGMRASSTDLKERLVRASSALPGADSRADRRTAGKPALHRSQPVGI